MIITITNMNKFKSIMNAISSINAGSDPLGVIISKEEIRFQAIYGVNVLILIANMYKEDYEVIGLDEPMQLFVQTDDFVDVAKYANKDDIMTIILKDVEFTMNIKGAKNQRKVALTLIAPPKDYKFAKPWKFTKEHVLQVPADEFWKNMRFMDNKTKTPSNYIEIGIKPDVLFLANTNVIGTKKKSTKMDIDGNDNKFILDGKNVDFVMGLYPYIVNKLSGTFEAKDMINIVVLKDNKAAVIFEKKFSEKSGISCIASQVIKD